LGKAFFPKKNKPVLKESIGSKKNAILVIDWSKSKKFVSKKLEKNEITKAGKKENW